LAHSFHPTGNHVAAWPHPDAQIDAGTNYQHYADLAQTAERGKFDLMFLADAVAVRDGKLSGLSRWPQYMVFFDPLTLLSAIAPVTSHLCLVATVTTRYNEPYNVARRFGSLDHISGGRAGWNVVTSTNLSAAYNFGREAHFKHDERYDRAIEFAEIVFGLWDSWDDDAFVRDRASGRYFDPAKLHVLNHKGEHFSVQGPLNVARPPQGHPVIFQAGSSEVGRELAARIAEGVFRLQHALSSAQEFYRDLKGRMAKYGRAPDELKIMPGLNPVVGRTTAEAEEKHRFLQSLIHPDVGLELLSTLPGMPHERCCAACTRMRALRRSISVEPRHCQASWQLSPPRRGRTSRPLLWRGDPGPAVTRDRHLKSGPSRSIGAGGRFAARAGFVRPHRRLCSSLT
jgi:FMN-dependent oxidoreductase (nitrilotriacetate monooxygenase family)